MVKDMVKSEEKPLGFCEQKGEGAEEHNQGGKVLHTKSKSNKVVKFDKNFTYSVLTQS